MGNFYTNIILRKVAPDAVAHTLADLGRKAYVTRHPGNVVAVYEQRMDEQDLGELSDLCERLSDALQTVAWGVLVHDDHVLCYELWERGQCLDEYCSDPDYFGEPGDADEPDPGGGGLPRDGGDGELLARAFGVPARASELQTLLDQPQTCMFASDLHTRLAAILQIPEDWVLAGFNHLTMGEMLPGLSPDELLLVGV